MINIHDYDISLIEREIVKKFNSTHEDYTDFHCLLSLRRDMINKRVLAHQEEILPNIIAFNNAVTEALHKMYDRAYEILGNIEGCFKEEDLVRISANCYLSNEYPRLHPVQGEGRQELWEAICDGGWNPLYEHGVSLMTLTLPQCPISFENFIGSESQPSNWNEGLDPELTKDLHLTSAFHHLFDHTKFAITDFIYVREFETEFSIDIKEENDL